MKKMLLLAVLFFVGCGQENAGNHTVWTAASRAILPGTSFSVAADESVLSEIPEKKRNEITNRVSESIKSELTSRGYVVTGSDLSSCKLFYSVIIDDEAVEYFNKYRGPIIRMMEGNNLRKGALAIEIFDDGGLVIWSGLVDGRINVEASNKEKDRRVADVVKALIDGIPAR